MNLRKRMLAGALSVALAAGMTTPAALASAIAIDIPVTLGFFTVGGLYHLTFGQQQQPTTPDKP
jgi:hypothetical protein